MKLIFIRHPETEANVQRKIYGRTESDYSEKGRKSIEWVIDHTKNMEFHRIYASPLKRTAFLAEQIAQAHGIATEEIRFSDELLEMHMGIFEDMTIDQVKEEHPDEFNKFIKFNSSHKITDGESFDMVQSRAVNFVKELAAELNAEGDVVHTEKSEKEKTLEDSQDIGAGITLEELEDDLVDRIEAEGSNDEKTVLVVAHSMVIRGILAWMLNMSLDDIWHIDIKPASVTEVLYKYDYGMILSLNYPPEVV